MFLSLGINCTNLLLVESADITTYIGHLETSYLFLRLLEQLPLPQLTIEVNVRGFMEILNFR